MLKMSIVFMGLVAGAGATSGQPMRPTWDLEREAREYATDPQVACAFFDPPKLIIGHARSDKSQVVDFARPFSPRENRAANRRRFQVGAPSAHRMCATTCTRSRSRRVNDRVIPRASICLSLPR